MAIDKAQTLVRQQAFAPEATGQTVFGTVDTYRYRAYVLESVRIAGDGLTLPLPTEFCENVPDADPESTQDGELKAFRRLAQRLQRWVRRRRWILVMDGLYPKGPVFHGCRANPWDVMMVLPARCLPNVWKAFAALQAASLDGLQRSKPQWGDRFPVFTRGPSHPLSLPRPHGPDPAHRGPWGAG
ncbi:MAG: hypothetical protein M1600_15960 [Firmicutes bacterium]|nr:hypothetical protein [Bacillota bacterium]